MPCPSSMGPSPAPLTASFNGFVARVQLRLSAAHGRNGCASLFSPAGKAGIPRETKKTLLSPSSAAASCLKAAAATSPVPFQAIEAVNGHGLENP